MSDVKTILSDDERRERFPLGAQVRLADLDADPYPILARLRREEPVTWVPETQMWFLTRRAEIVDVLRDASRFTTEAEIDYAAARIVETVQNMRGAARSAAAE